MGALTGLTLGAAQTLALPSGTRYGRSLRVPSAQLVRGDVLILGEGDAVGADARLIESAALHIQEASLTGESEAVLKEVVTLAGPAALGDQRGMVFRLLSSAGSQRGSASDRRAWAPRRSRAASVASPMAPVPYPPVCSRLDPWGRRSPGSGDREEAHR